MSKFLALKTSLRVGNVRSCFFFQVSNIDSFWDSLSFDGQNVQTVSETVMEILLTAMIPCG